MTQLLFRLLLLLTAASPLRDGFPHERHARVFPLCDGCHAGIVQAGGEVFPDAASCARCHDGTRKPRVSWTTPSPRPTNLRFQHAAHLHASTAKQRPADCSACHQAEGGGRMAVTAPLPQACFACHAGSGHIDEAGGCRTCHAPLAEVAAWDTTRIAALPQPAAHRAPGFLHAHGSAANQPGAPCATCHARESCARCHPNADRLPAITALAADARIAALVRGRPARYDPPASHAPGWEFRHGQSATTAAGGCANCHTRTTCTACHVSGNQVTRALPAGGAAGPGVRYSTTPRVHARNFARGHQAAGANDAGCLGCHERQACDQCHATLRAGGFHEPNFTEQHGAAAYGSDVQCSSCHSTERFCRACHAGTGRASEGRRDLAFHNNAPLWLLGHGQAARQSLEGCASCHAQADCTRCHSARTGWGVNPHGSSFNAAKLGAANRLTCLRCHTAAELERE